MDACKSTFKPKFQINGNKRLVKSGKITLDDFVSQIYLPFARTRKRSWRLDESINRRHISPVFGKRQLAAIERGEIEGWLNGLLEKGLAKASCNRFLALFKSICALAERRGHILQGQSPCQGISPFKIRSYRERCLSEAEAVKLMRALKKRDCLESKIIQLLLLTGAGKSEILKSRWENINLEQGILTVPVSKSGNNRHIVLSDAAREIVKTLPRKPGCPWLFPGSAKSGPLSDIFLFWNKLRKELGLEAVRIHDLRHSFASFLVNSGHSLYQVQKMLGHGDPRTTMRYAHLGQSTLVAAAERVSLLLSASVGDEKIE